MTDLKINSKHGIDYLNILLMIVSAVAAFILPFQLFIFSYAVLGPLHYLTEIGWLHQRNYFTQAKNDYKILIGITFFIIIINNLYNHQNSALLKQIPMLVSIIRFLFNSYSGLVMTAFSISVVMVFFSENKSRYKMMAFLFLGVLLIQHFSFVYIIFGLFLPTVIHVFIFTLLFILFGALKSKSAPGIASFILMLLIPCLLFSINTSALVNEKHVAENFLITSFNSLNVAISKLFGVHQAFNFDNILNIKIERFLAFAYTYHYLNWFSKTKIIRWHEAPRVWIYSSFAIWILAVLLYFYDFKLGFSFLFLLSLLHVFLEFPLNIITMKGIFSFVKKE